MTKQDDTTPPVDDTSVEDSSVDSGQDEGLDWDDAFNDLYEKEDTGKDDSDDDSGEGDPSGDPPADSASDDPQTKKSEEEDVVGKTDVEKEETDPSEEQRKVVKDAIQEVYSEQQQESAQTKALVEEALSITHPEGIPDPRVDSDGDKLEGPEDVEKLYNPNTGELFTPEEARSWWNQANKQYEQNVQSAQQEAFRVAGVSMRLEKGREAVMRNYGDFINENPEVAQKVLQRYMSTLKVAGEGENQYIAEAPIDILEFYNDVMYPYVELAEKKKEAEAAAAEAEKKKQDDLKRSKAHRDESRDFPSTVGEDATKTSEESDWDDAFKQYYGGK